MLIYVYLRCIHKRCKFRTEISTGKYLKMIGLSEIPCAKTGVKHSLVRLGTQVLI